MYAIFEFGSHQYRVHEGDLVTVDCHEPEPGKEVVFENVLLVSGEGGAQIGAPLIPGARVLGTIVEQSRDKKIIIQKFRRRKNMRRRRGHRQSLVTVRINTVSTGSL